MAVVVAAEGVKPLPQQKNGSLPARVDEVKEKEKGRVAGGVHLPPAPVPRALDPQPVQALASAMSANGSGRTTRTTSSVFHQANQEIRRVGRESPNLGKWESQLVPEATTMVAGETVSSPWSSSMAGVMDALSLTPSVRPPILLILTSSRGL